MPLFSGAIALAQPDLIVGDRLAETGDGYVVHDPFGDLDLVNGGYLSSDGKAKVYSKKNLGPRWMVESNRSGWYIKAHK